MIQLFNLDNHEIGNDSLIGFTIRAIFKKDASCVSKMSWPSTLTVNTELSKRSTKSNKHDIYHKSFNHAFLSKPEFESFRNDVKKRCEDEKIVLDVNKHQMKDHPITFMKIIKGRENSMSAANDERRQVLNPCVIWDKCIH
jgi:hypothetical protein